MVQLKVYQLIKKDFMIQKKTLMLSMILMAFFAMSFAAFESAGLVMSVVAFSYLFVQGASAIEDKSNSDVLLVSLPIKRTTIVLAKYLSIYVFAALGLAIQAVIHALAELMNISRIGFPITMDGIFGVFVSVSLIFSILLPLIFKFGFIKSRMVNSLIFILCFFGGAKIAEQFAGQLNLEIFNSLSDAGLKLLTTLAVLILLWLSYMLSLHFYRNREF